jgi:transcriptional regulator with XRE-family HTH domain
LLGLSQEKLEELTGLERRTIGRLEAGKSKLISRDVFKVRAELEKKGVEFIDASSAHGLGVRWKNPGKVDPFQSAQLRAGRALAGLSQSRLAELAEVDRNFITRIENDKPKALRDESLRKVIGALDKLGVELTAEGDTFGAGARFKPPTPDTMDESA